METDPLAMMSTENIDDNAEIITPDFLHETSRSNSPANPDDLETKGDKTTGGVSLRQDPKLCGVCGDKALGNNFNAITCESCKAFFRRNALKTKEFVCPFNDNCKVDPVTRRFCQKCRLKKCFDIGMKKEWILTDAEKKMKKSKIEQNRMKRQSSDTVPTSNSSAQDSPLPKILCLSSNENSNPSTPGAVSLVMSSSPAGSNSNCNYPSNIHTPSPPDPTLPYTKGSKMAVTPTCRSNYQHQHNKCDGGSDSMILSANYSENHGSASCSNDNQTTTGDFTNSNHNNNNNFSDAKDIVNSCSPSPSSEVDTFAGFSGLLTPVNNSQKQVISSSNNNSNKVAIAMSHSQAVLEHQHRHASSMTMATIQSNQQSQRKYSNPNPNDLYLDTSLHSNYNNNNSSNCNGIQDSSGHEHLGWCSGESSSSSSSPLQISSSTMDTNTATNTGSHSHHHSSLTAPAHTSPSGYAAHEHPGTPQSRTSGNYKLLTSLIRPGITESPPDSNLLDCSTSNISAKPIDDYSVLRSVMEKRIKVDDASSEDPHFQQCHSHSQNPFQHFTENEMTELPLPLNTMDSILSVAIKAEFNAFGVLGGPQCGLQSSRELNNAERAKLNELLLASEALNTPVDAEGPIKVSGADHDSLINVINLTDIAIRRLIKMSKKISGFKNMCQEDQIALLKGSCTEMMILRSVVTYDPDRDSWNIPHSNLGYNIKLGVLKEARGNLYEEHQRFARSFKPSWRLDENIMIIMCAITLFTAERPNVIHKDVVKLEQDSYYYLLKRYLESIVNGCEARSTYLQLIGKIAELHNLNSNHLRVFLEVNPREVEPLLIEIFDLK